MKDLHHDRYLYPMISFCDVLVQGTYQKLIIAVLFLCPLIVFAQKGDYVLEVWDSIGNQGLEGVEVAVTGYEGDKKQLFTTNRQGIAVMKLVIRPVYRIELTRSGYLHKVVVMKKQGSKERVYLSMENDTANIARGDHPVRATNASLPLVVDMKNPPQRRESDRQARADRDLSEQLGQSQNRRTVGLSRLPSQFNGWTIEVMSAQSSLSPEHPLLQKNDLVYWEKEKSGTYLYFVGSYHDFDEAYEYFEENLQKEYPGAIMSEYIDGVRQ